MKVYLRPTNFNGFYWHFVWVTFSVQFLFYASFCCWKNIKRKLFHCSIPSWKLNENKKKTRLGDTRFNLNNFSDHTLCVTTKPFVHQKGWWLYKIKLNPMQTWHKFKLNKSEVLIHSMGVSINRIFYRY